MSRQPSTPIEHTEFVGRTRDETSEYIGRTIIGHQPQFPRQDRTGEFRVRSAATPDVRADQFHITMNFRATMEPFDYLFLCRLGQGRLSLVRPGEEQHLSRGDVGLYPIGVPVQAGWQDTDVSVLCLPLAVATAMANEQSGIEASDLRFESMTPVSPTMSRYWNDLFTLAGRQLMASDSAMTNPLVSEQVVRTLAQGVLTTFPNTSMTAAQLADPGHVAPAAVRRAASYMDGHAAQPITMAEVAAAAGLSARALQYGFARHYEITPSEYLRRVRLAGAHLDLAAAQPGDGQTVAAVAARWGFAKPGRFAASYRKAYGTLPSHALRT